MTFRASDVINLRTRDSHQAFAGEGFLLIRSYLYAQGHPLWEAENYLRRSTATLNLRSDKYFHQIWLYHGSKRKRLIQHEQYPPF